MRSAFKCLLIMVLLISLGCKGDERDEPVTAESPLEITAEPQAETGDGSGEGSEDAQYREPAIPSLSEIRSVKVTTISDNPRGGFRPGIEYSGEHDESTGFIYEWKLNGNDITGSNDEELEWGEGFKKGDTITVTVTPLSDLGQGAVSAEGSFRIPNSPPVISSEPDTSFKEGKFSYIVQAEDPDGDPVDFSLRGAPSGMTIEPAAGLIIWEYGEKDAGDYKVTVIVTDSEGAQASQELTLSINPQESSAEQIE